jgi:hypothetical protein
MADATVVFDAGGIAGPWDGGDASTDAGASAGLRDAAVADAAQPSRADASSTPCAGESVSGLCWYLSSNGRSCNDTCSSHGGYDPRGASFVGTDSQGGSLEECAQILRSLGRSSRVIEGMRSDDNGFGCHLWSDGSSWWLRSPQFRPDVQAEGSGIGIACACSR